MGRKQTEMPGHPTYPGEGGGQPKLSNPHLPSGLPPGLSDQDTKGTKNTSLLQKQATPAAEETAESGVRSGSQSRKRCGMHTGRGRIASAPQESGVSGSNADSRNTASLWGSGPSRETPPQTA